MKVNAREDWDGGLLRLEVTDRTLVEPPDWGGIRGLSRQDTLLVALDLRGVEFVSSLFLEGCVELGRTLAARGDTDERTRGLHAAALSGCGLWGN